MSRFLPFCALAVVPGLAAAQVTASDVAAQLNGQLIQFCAVPASQIGLRVDPTGVFRLERSPTLTAEQNKCIDAAAARAKIPIKGVVGATDTLTSEPQ